MDPLTIALLAQAGIGIGSGIASMFRKKPKAPRYPDFVSMSPELKAKMLAQIKSRIDEQANQTYGTLGAGAIRRGFGQSGQRGQIARDVQNAANKDYTGAITGIEVDELQRYRDYLANRANFQSGIYGSQMGEYGQGTQAAGGSFGGGLSNLLDYLMMNQEEGSPERDQYMNWMKGRRRPI